MATDLTVHLEDKPGSLARMAQALGNAGVNIDGVAGVQSDGRGIIHVLVEDAAAARRALQNSGIQVQAEEEVLVVDAEDKPGELARIAGRVANASVNITLIYLATNTRIVLGVSDLDEARQALSA